MKQLFQDLSNGQTYIINAPSPKAAPGAILIASMVSFVSVGTERMLVEFGKGSYIQKARQQPEKVR